MRLTTLLMLATIALAPTSAVAANNSKGCISLQAFAEKLKISVARGDTVVVTDKRSEVDQMAAEFNSVPGHKLSSPPVSIVFIRYADGERASLVFVERNKVCDVLTAPVPVINEFVIEALGDVS